MDNSYKFSEIILALRKEYIKNEKLLRRLEKCLIVRDANVNINASIVPSITSRDVNNIRIDIFEKQGNIKKVIERIKYEMFGIIASIEPNRIVKKDNDKYILGFEDYTTLEGCGLYPKYYIEFFDKTLFNETVEEIVNSDFMKLPDFGDYLNPFQFLNLKADNISLSGSFGSIKPNAYPTISYNSKNDTIHAFPSKGGTQIVMDFLNTRIPKYFIPEEYREIIEKSIKDSRGKISKEVDIPYPIKKDSELNIVEKSQKYTLVKKRNLKFYEQ